jgi:hypothetical protein
MGVRSGGAMLRKATVKSLNGLGFRLLTVEL